MPAKAHRIHLYSELPDEPNKVVDFPAWWDRRRFFSLYGDREYDTQHPFEVNYAYKLTMEEALQFDRECQRIAYPNPRRIVPLVLQKIKEFRAAVANSKWVIIESYEWESGMS